MATAGTTPPVRVGLLVAVATVGWSAAMNATVLNLLPRALETVAGSGRILGLGVLIAAGAPVGLLATLLGGVLSDRGGRRRGRWIIAGTVVLTLAVAALPLQHSLTGLVVTWFAFQLGLGVAAVNVGALVPDHVPPDRLGRVCALATVGTVAGAVLGTAVVALPGTSLRTDGVLIALLAAALLLPAGAVRLAPPELLPAEAVAHGPVSYRDFWLAWMTRVTVGLSNLMVMTYLLYFLQDVVHHPDPTQGQFVLVLVVSFWVTVTALSSGWLSDRYRRRKALVVASMLVLAVAEGLLAGWTAWPMVILAAAVFGIGYGAYLAIDHALINEVLPQRTRIGRDLGLFAIANAAPQILGPLAAAALVAGGGYAVLYAVTAVCTLSGIAFVLPIRGVR